MQDVDSSVGITSEPILTRDGNRETDIIKEAIDRAQYAYESFRDNLDRAEEDTNFIFGRQYTNDELNAYDEENRIAMVFNKLPQFINKVTGQQRSSVRTIKVSRTGRALGGHEPDFVSIDGEKIRHSVVLSKLIRDIEYSSNAQAWYKMAFKHALQGGFGWLRVLTKYQEDGFDIDPKISGVRDRWSVIPDPDAKEIDMSDMKFCFIIERMKLSEFQKRYPGKSYESIIPDSARKDYYLFGNDSEITVTEYFRREPVRKELVLLSSGEAMMAEDFDEIKESLAKRDITEVKRRSVMRHKVIWCKLTHGGIVEKEVEFPTSTIPVVPVLGRVEDLRDSSVQTKGLINDGKDAQLALNRMRSSSLERIDQSPLAPFIAEDKAIEGYEREWAAANTSKLSTLRYRAGQQKPQRDQGAAIPVAELQVGSVLDEDMKASIGIFNASLGATSNEISGKAIKARQTEADVGTYEFVDNFDNALRRIGILLVEMIPRVYDTNRFIQIRGKDDSVQIIELNKINDQTGELENTFENTENSVTIETGASYETEREENADQIIELSKVAPQVMQVGSDLLVKNLDFAESDVLAERLEKTIPPHLLSKEQKERMDKEGVERQPSPEQIAVQAEQQKAQMEMQAKQQELSLKLEIEKVKLQTAELNLKAKEVEAGIKADLNIDKKADEIIGNVLN